MTNNTYLELFDKCRNLFEKKTYDYGTSWRILRPSSLTDQIFIKAKRIRSIQEAGEQKITDPIIEDYIGMVNYAIIALIQSDLPDDAPLELGMDAVQYYDEWKEDVFTLMKNKNHDYGEAWRDLRLTTIVDLILQKLLRIKQIEDNNGKTLVSEGISSGYMDIINYSIFSMILMEEEKKEKKLTVF